MERTTIIMKLLALDGNSIVNRAFYGIKLLTTKDGRYTNGIYGFINILNRLLELEQPDGLAVAFDLREPTFRHQKYAAYKAGRKGMPPELAEQVPVLKELLTLMGYRCLEAPGFEADDILGTLAKAAAGGGGECVIATGDRDSLQLVGEKVKVLLAATKMGRPEVVTYDETAIREKYGVEPAGMLEIKALMGDSSDNIPGVPGIGEKTALDLIGRFGTLDGVYANLDSPDLKPAVRAKLEAGRDSAYLSRELGKICCDVPVPLNLEEYRPAPVNRPELYRMLTGLEFFKLIEKMGLTGDAPAESGNPPLTEYIPAADAAALLEAAKAAGQADILFRPAEKLCGVAAGKSVGALALDTSEGLEAASALLSDGSVKKRVSDAKSIYKWGTERGIQVSSIIFDSMLAGYLCSPSASSYETERLAAEYAVTPPAVAGEASELLRLTALHSAVCDRMGLEIDKNGQQELFTTIELPLAEVLADMELAGFLIDVQGVQEMGRELAGKIGAIETEIYGLVGYEFNLNSPKQLGEALFVKLGLPTRKKTKSGFSTNAEVLESLRYEHPAVELLLQYRQLAKLKSTYCDGLPKTADAGGRIHSTLNQTETRTGRISSTEPNLQNIPIRQEEGRQLRRYFRAADGCVLCDADYSQIELRVLAHMAGDSAMIHAFANEIDIHTLTSSQVFHLPPEMVTPMMRSRAKAVNFGIVYGIGAFSLAKDIGVTRAEADRYIKGYFETYPQVKEYMDRTVDEAKQQGFAVTLFGRRRYLPELSSSNANLRAFGERVARNMPVQGTAADIIKIAMVRVWHRLKAEKLRARLILQVHDELIVEADEADRDAVCRLLEEEMEGACRMAVPLLAEVHYGKTWYDAKG